MAYMTDAQQRDLLKAFQAIRGFATFGANAVATTRHADFDFETVGDAYTSIQNELSKILNRLRIASCTDKPEITASPLDGMSAADAKRGG